MNIIHLHKITKIFQLGEIITEPVKVDGGLLHLMWRVETEKGIYAIKELNKYVDLNSQKIIDNYNLTENIAKQFAGNGIPAISALELNSKSLLVINNIGYLVYPWTDAITGDYITNHHLVSIARIIAHIHSINLNIADVDASQFDIHTSNYIAGLIDKTQQANNSFASNLLKYKDTLVEINDKYINATGFLSDEYVVSHGDLDPKNVLWTNDNSPILIDWESARAINPTYDIINTAIEWSNNTKGLNESMFKIMISAYQNAGGVINKNHIKPALFAVSGNMINWLVYNIKRTYNDEQKQMSTQQVDQTITNIIRLNNMIPNLVKLTKNINKEEDNER